VLRKPEAVHARLTSLASLVKADDFAHLFLLTVWASDRQLTCDCRQPLQLTERRLPLPTLPTKGKPEHNDDRKLAYDDHGLADVRPRYA
jgi:hypothetical protein